MAKSLDSPEIVCKNDKIVMGWKCSGTHYHLKVNNHLVATAQGIAKLNNEFFIEKAHRIISGMRNAIFSFAKVKETMQKYVAEKNVNGQVQAFIKCWLVQLCLLPF